MRSGWMRRVVVAMSACAAVALMLPVAGARQDQASALKYRLRVTPGNLQVDRMPGPGPAKSYTENFSFAVTNPGAAEWEGSAPSCQTMDIVVTPVEKPDEVVWQWSHGQMFCMHVTDIKIAAGRRWKHTEEWKFSVADVKDGKYRATATFVATKQTATAEFEITSVQ
jgi:hypothetical protein